MTPASTPTRPPTEGHHSSGRGVGVLLPADWHVVPLGDPAASRRAIAALVEHQFGTTDTSATLRRQARVGLTSAAERAALSGGWVMAFMLTQAGPLPLPATLTGYRVRGSFADDAGVAQVQQPLTAHVATCAAGRVDAGEGPFGLVLRGIRERTGPADLGAQDLPVLVCDYWTDPDDGNCLVNLCFSTPMVWLRDGFIDLFDAIAGTAYRIDDDEEEESPGDGPQRADPPPGDPPRDSEPGELS